MRSLRLLQSGFETHRGPTRLGTRGQEAIVEMCPVAEAYSGGAGLCGQQRQHPNSPSHGTQRGAPNTDPDTAQTTTSAGTIRCQIKVAGGSVHHLHAGTQTHSVRWVPDRRSTNPCCFNCQPFRLACVCKDMRGYITPGPSSPLFCPQVQLLQLLTDQSSTPTL